MKGFQLFIDYKKLAQDFTSGISKSELARQHNVSRRTIGRWLEKAESQDFLNNAAQEISFPAENVSCYWVKTETGSFLVRKDTENDNHYETMRDDFFESVKNHEFKYEPLEQQIGNYLLVIDIADIHFGKLSVVDETGTKYDMDIARERLVNGVKDLLSDAVGFGIDKIVFVLGNDSLHVDNHLNTTTSGTRQDAAGLWYQHFEAARKAYIEAIEYCRSFADVKLIYNPSNHDWKTGKHLADSIAAWFRNDGHVEVTDAAFNMSHRKYLQYGANLLGFTHGDGAKENSLPSLMQYEAREAWSKTKFAYWHLHHLHHKIAKNYGKSKSVIETEKDHVGVTVLKNSTYKPEETVKVEYIRSPSESDGWHDRNGYVSQAAVECFMYHADKGQKVRLTAYF